MRRRYWGPVLLAGILLSVVALTPVLAQSANYGLSVDGSIDLPDRTVEFEGDSYQVSAVAQTDPGGSATVDVTAPSDQLVEVTVYNADRQIVDSKDIVGSGSLSFDLSGFEPGSYMLTLQYDGDTRAVHPLVIRAYDVSLTAPAEASGDVTLSATLTELRSAPTSGVEFVVANDDELRRIDATAANGTYEATTDLSDLPTGEYSVYATVRGTKEVDGKRVRLAISQPQSLTLQDEQSGTEGDSSDDESADGGTNAGGGSSDGDSSESDSDSGGDSSNSGSSGAGSSAGGADGGSTDGDDQADESDTDSNTGSTETGTDPTTEGQQTPSDPSSSETDSSQQPGTATPDQGETGTTTEVGTGSNVITPGSAGDAAQDPGTTTSGSGPGFGAGVTVSAVLTAGLVFLGRRWRID